MSLSIARTAFEVAQSLIRRRVVVVAAVAAADHGLLVREIELEVDVIVINASMLNANSLPAVISQAATASQVVMLTGVQAHQDGLVAQVIGFASGVAERHLVVMAACQSDALPATMALADDLLSLPVAASLAETIARTVRALREPNAGIVAVLGVVNRDHGLFGKAVGAAHPRSLAVEANMYRDDVAIRLAAALMPYAINADYIVVTEAERITLRIYREFMRVAHIATGLPVVLVCESRDPSLFPTATTVIMHGEPS